MHRAFLRAAALIGVLAVMAAAGGCVALYTLSRAGDGPDDAGEGVGLPLFPPGGSTPVSPITVTATVTARADGGDGLPFNPYMTDTPPVPVLPVTETPPGADSPSSNATLPGTPVETEAPLVDGPPPGEEVRGPAFPATPP